MRAPVPPIGARKAFVRSLRPPAAIRRPPKPPPIPMEVIERPDGRCDLRLSRPPKDPAERSQLRDLCRFMARRHDAVPRKYQEAEGERMYWDALRHVSQHVAPPETQKSVLEVAHGPQGTVLTKGGLYVRPEHAVAAKVPTQ